MSEERTVSFTAMEHGTKEDYELLAELEKPHHAMTADRLLRELHSQEDETLAGYKITRLQHALQSATRAEADGADIDWVVAALLHDIGDGLDVGHGLAGMRHGEPASDVQALDPTAAKRRTSDHGSGCTDRS